MEVKDTPSQDNSFGTILRMSREKKNISLETVSKDLYIKKRQLEALETEDFEALPQHTFARGFASSYAKYLGLDVKEITELFDKAYPDSLKKTRLEDIESPIKAMGKVNRDGGNKVKFNLPLTLAVLAVIGLAVFLFRMVNNAENQVDSVEGQESLLTLDEQQQGASINTNQPEEIDLSTIQSTGSALSVQQENQETESGDTLADADGVSVIEFWVRANTNINVVDAEGNVLVSGTKGRGGFDVQGKAPFTVKIDNVSNVNINLNKNPVALSKYSQDNQADFQLKP